MLYQQLTDMLCNKGNIHIHNVIIIIEKIRIHIKILLNMESAIKNEEWVEILKMLQENL